ncbi:MAG: hypothetical protein J3Q66DRAFT_175780 [Benniella sp.]|nr:MAG: hypothetical protein J3Q66DRAFT_175780 [Benniella sp.]
MWNPPPPDLQISLKHRLGVPTPQRSTVSNGYIPSNDGTPRASQSNDHERAVDSSFTNNNVNTLNNVNERLGNALPYTASFRPTFTSTLPHPRLEKVAPYLTIATLQAYTVLTVVRCLADPVWIVVKSGKEKNSEPPAHIAEIGSLEKSFLACAIGFTMLSCLGVTLRIMDKLPWLRRIPVVTAYLEGYGNLSPKTTAGQVIFFFYGLFGISSLGFFVVSLRNAVIEQFQWRLLDRFSKPAHLTRVQTRMSAKDISFPEARFEEEQRVKILVKRKMIVRMIIVWIIMWFGGAGVFCAFEPWTFVESLYFCFVTLTTIGFGDYVPKQPGAIEFWNVYVFVGLSVFAYILSLSSESMAAQIHLVDDRDEDDDDMYGWERNEDPNAPLTTRSGVLGIEGLKWLQHQQQIQIQGTNNDFRTDEDGKGAGNIGSVSNTMHNYDVGNSDCDHSAHSTFQRSQSKTKGSPGRVLTVSAKERKQMLQAEYYASHSLPATIRFVDTKGIPHEKTIHRGTSNNENTSGPSGSTSGDQHGITYGTVGYYGTVGRRELENMRRSSRLRNLSGVGVAETVHARSQPQITFGTPTSTVRSRGGRGELDERRESEVGRIPSCMDLFRQTNLRDGEGPSKHNSNLLRIQEESLSRVRSNSWDQSTTQQRLGPSQNDIHRWLAEDAGTLEGPSFNYVPQEHLQPISINHPRQSQSSDGTRVTGSPDDFDKSTIESLKRSSYPETLAHSPLKSEWIHHQEGIAPDEIVVPMTTEPTVMTADEEGRFHAGQEVVQTGGFDLRLNRSEDQAPGTNNLYLGGGSGAGLGPHAYGGPFPESNNNGGGENIAVPRPIELFDDDNDRPFTLLQSNHSQPLSLFANHPRSGQVSGGHTPSGSVHHSRPPSVLLTIFNEPVRDLPGSRSLSRANSTTGSRLHSRGGSTEYLNPNPSAADEPGDHPHSVSRVLSTESLGPFDETRNPETIPHFDQDVDLNHLELTPQQIEEENLRRADQRRRQKEIESRLASLRDKGRGDYV